MLYYFAPMEGITGYVFRRIHRECFPGMDKYFTPFLTPSQKKAMTPRENRDVLPENNQEVPLVPQILTNCAEDFIKTARNLQEYGYEEVNLNLGCPSGTVVSKKKGSGFLEFPEELHGFLEVIFQNLDMKISIKTRIGKEEEEEFSELLKIYNEYPLEELIIHPRVQKDYYKNKPRMEVYKEAVSGSKNPLCYNGDLFTEGYFRRFTEEFPDTRAVMMGRGLLVNPALVRQLQGGKALEKEELKNFHDKLLLGYEEVMDGDQAVLFKMKELWFYMGNLFPEGKKYLKKIKKAQHLPEYREVVQGMFENLELQLLDSCQKRD